MAAHSPSGETLIKWRTGSDINLVVVAAVALHPVEVPRPFIAHVNDVALGREERSVLAAGSELPWRRPVVQWRNPDASTVTLRCREDHGASVAGNVVVRDDIPGQNALLPSAGYIGSPELAADIRP
ncbi:MAG TPA: hypothetical protein VEW05_28775 [Candidatus Polarisedimenticolia bacterium]|nr:hypothetical protein [Candidatus Polarisedimenticolia bacterium]